MQQQPVLPVVEVQARELLDAGEAVVQGLAVDAQLGCRAAGLARAVEVDLGGAGELLMGGGEERGDHGVVDRLRGQRGQQAVRADERPLRHRAEPRFREGGASRGRRLLPDRAQLREAGARLAETGRHLCPALLGRPSGRGLLQQPGRRSLRRRAHLGRAQPYEHGQALPGRAPRHRAQRGRVRHRPHRRGVVGVGRGPRSHADDRMDAVRARAEGRAQLGDRHVALPAALGGQRGPQLPAQVGPVLRLVREQRADPGCHLHRGRQLLVRGPGIVVQEPDVAPYDTPVAYRQADSSAVHPRLRSARDPYRPGGACDAEALEPGPHGRRGAARQDRAGAHGVQGRRVELVLAVVGPEGDQLEVPVLQRRGGAQELRDLVDQLLVVTLEFRRHPGILPHSPGLFIHLSEICGTDA